MRDISRTLNKPTRLPQHEAIHVPWAGPATSPKGRKHMFPIEKSIQSGDESSWPESAEHKHTDSDAGLISGSAKSTNNVASGPPNETEQNDTRGKGSFEMEYQQSSENTRVNGRGGIDAVGPQHPQSHEIEDNQLADQTAELSIGSEPLESSVTTLKPLYDSSSSQKEPRAPTPPPKDGSYLDPTPRTPLTSRPPSRSPSNSGSKKSESDIEVYSEQAKPQNDPTRGEAGYEDGESMTKGQIGGDSKSEIQSIMDQFDEEGGGPGVDEVMSPRLEFASPFLGGTIQHPPRKSSLEPVDSQGLGQSVAQPANSVPTSYPSEKDLRTLEGEIGPPVPPKPSPKSYPTPEVPTTPTSPPAMQKSQPPEPDPEPDLPFDFHRFLEQLRHRTADPVARFLRSFLMEFGKKQWMVHEQVKIISDFLVFITNKMGQCEVWRDVSDAEFDNAREGMEKLVMNRLYTQTFSPALPPPQLQSDTKGKRRQPERHVGPGRRGQHQEDVERDDVLAQKVRIYGWIREEHLDIHPVEASGKRFLNLAQQELLKIRTYRAPRDKVICVLNCCKVIFGLLRNSGTDQSADSFIPMLIYVVLQANPEHLVSNVQYILRFRNQDKLGGEAGYYLSSLMGAIQFIENMDRTTLTISDEEFERNVVTAVSAIAERPQPESHPPNQVHISEKSTISRPEVNPRNSLDGEWSTARRSTSSREGTDSSVENVDEKDAVVGLLRTIQRPLTTIGRIFSEEATSQQPQQRAPSYTPDRIDKSLPSPLRPERPSSTTHQRGYSNDRIPFMEPMNQGTSVPQNKGHRLLHAEDAAALQASAEAAEAQRLQRAEHAGIVEWVSIIVACFSGRMLTSSRTLSGMFPSLDKEVIDDVVRMKEGRVGLAVDACLSLSS
ncbi:MAG: hypothetical protein M1837_000402 [Sclerophora amabilis]|nr:MAG: hypothetical protein M1837_000402 [Sclerophora amabilis]